ncbi:C-X-C chemokine receptor type 2-like isoform X2 [Pristis pectinata]|uniref:C-X-C chemokine receptor type 2-like isoform X2 n=1 Tax=Pristis pectinata TaxID=685728 RepID=UPI00223D0614|nr:C-X-C chemokine receptor type 2-like isoform X2 [Pristis pectinata]
MSFATTIHPFLKENATNPDDLTTEFEPDPSTFSCNPEIYPAMNTLAAVVYSLVCFLAVMGNLVVMTVILYNRRTTSTTDVYLLNLATADLLFALSLPFWAVDAISGWVFGDAMCKVVSVLQEVNIYSGILLLACISVDRYLAIVHSAQKQNRPFLTKLVCGVVWVMAVLLSLPILYKSEIPDNSSEQFICNEDHDGEFDEAWRLATKTLRHVIGFLIPLGVMVFCYSVTIHRLCQTKGFQKQKAMKVIIAVVLAFLVCWLPHNVTVLIDTLLRRKHIADSCVRRHHIDRALSATQSLGFLHSCINPILYAFIGVKFRRNLLKLLADKGLVKEREESQFRRSVQSSVNGTTSTTI